MKKKWLTKEKDMHLAQMFMEEYARMHQVEVLGLVEVFLNQSQKRMDFRVSNWITALAEKFNEMYGAEKADYIIRKVITDCMVKEQTLH